MQAYRFYFLRDDRIKAVETVECADDAAAEAMAATLLGERDGFEAIEVWNGKKLVHRHPRRP